MTNTIVLNLGPHGAMPPPNPDLPVLTINGVAIDGLVSIEFSAAFGEPTTVTLAIEATVEGRVEVDSGRIRMLDHDGLDAKVRLASKVSDHVEDAVLYQSPPAIPLADGGKI